MPLYGLRCKCGYTTEELIGIGKPFPECPQCGGELERVYSAADAPMLKVKGEGGYPSRRKQVFNTTFRKHPKLT